MLIVQIHNDGTGDSTVAHYDCSVGITTSPTTVMPIATARIENHRRGDGWRALLRRLADEGVDSEDVIDARRDFVRRFNEWRPGEAAN